MSRKPRDLALDLTGAKVLGVVLPEAPAVPGPWTLEVPGWQPATLNQLMHCHWGVKARLKRRDLKAVAAAVLAARVPEARGKRRVGLVVTLGPRQRGPDVDAFWKSTLDALVLCGALYDDGPKWCELAPVAYERGPHKATRILIEDI